MIRASNSTTSCSGIPSLLSEAGIEIAGGGSNGGLGSEPPWELPEAPAGVTTEEDPGRAATVGAHFDLRQDGAFWERRHLVMGCVMESEVPMTKESTGEEEATGHAALR